MDEEIRDMLGEAIKRQFDEIPRHETGSKERAEAIEDLAKLYRLHIEESKNESEFDEQQSRRFIEDSHFDDEMRFKKDQLRKDSKDKLAGWIIRSFEIALPLMCYGSWIWRGFKLEETGTIGSPILRNLLSKFKATK